MDEITAVRTFFAQRHITLNDEWEENVVRYIKLNVHKVDEDLESYNLPEVVFEQWLYSDLRESTRPVLNVPEKANSITIVKPALLQLMSIVDISESYYGQYRSRVMDLSKDDSEFRDPSEIPREQEKTKVGTKEINKFFVQPKKTMLMYEFSDGNITLKAVLGDSICGLDCNTLLGTKILLIPRYICRNRVIKLTAKNCQFLGGCNERCIEESSPVLKVLCRKLSINPEEAFLKASKSKTQLAQTMAAKTMIPQTKNIQSVVLQSVPSTSSDTSETTTIQPAPSLPKKPETNAFQAVKPLPLQPIKPKEGTVFISTFVTDGVKDNASVTGVKKSANDVAQQNLNVSSFNFLDSHLSHQPPPQQPPKPKYQPPKPPVNNDISVFDITNTSLNACGNGMKSTFTKPSIIKKPKPAPLNPKIKPKSVKELPVDDEGFKKQMPPVRPSINNGTYRNVPQQKENSKVENDGFKKPFSPVKRQTHSVGFVPETPAAIYNAIKPSKDLSEVNMGPKKLFHSLTNSRNDLQKRSVFKNELPIKSEITDVKLPPMSSFQQLFCGDTAILSDTLTGFRAVPHDSHNSNDSFKSHDGDPNANSRKSFDGLARDSEDEFMENIKANKSSQTFTPQREETSPFSIDREISLIPRKRLAEQPKTPPRCNPRKLNFSQPPGCIPRKKAQLEAGVERDDEKKKGEAQSSIIAKYKDLKVVKLNIVMNQKKFWLHSERRMINPIFCAPDDEIDMKNWTVKVNVNDGTFGDVIMLVDKELLNAVLGYSFNHLKKAMAENNNDELEQCRERAQNIRKIFSRLDLLLEVEFAPEPSSYPIIKKIKNLAKSLDII